MLAKIRPSSAICQPNTDSVALSKLGFLPVALCLASCLSQAFVSLSPSVLDLWSFSAWYRSSVSRSRFRPFRKIGNTQLERTVIIRCYTDVTRWLCKDAGTKLEIFCTYQKQRYENILAFSRGLGLSCLACIYSMVAWFGEIRRKKTLV